MLLGNLSKDSSHIKYVDLPLVEKYRPPSISEMISHNEIRNTIQNFLNKGTIPHLLFHGPSGTGKTTCALAIVNHFFKNKDTKQMVLELNSSDDRGIDIVRNDIKTFCSSSNLITNNYKFKIIILDESDMMTSTAQAALRRIIEKFTKNVRFILMCNHVSKIIPAIQSRCLRFRFSPIDPKLCIPKLLDICIKENYTIQHNTDNNKVLERLIEAGNRDMRRIINLLESTALSFDNIINEDNIYSISGKPSKTLVKEFIDFCNHNKTFKDCYSYIFDLKLVKGYTISDIVERICTILIEDYTSIDIKLKLKLLQHLKKIDYSYEISVSDKLVLSNIVSVVRQMN